MKITFVLICVLQLKGSSGYNTIVSSNPIINGWIGKEIVHSLNDTDVHRLCQGPLGCGSLRTNFTSTYNPNTRKRKEPVHTLNDTDVHRLCQGPLGCGTLKTNFTSSYNASARKINYVPPNHPTLDHSFRRLNPVNIFGEDDYVQREKDNSSSTNQIDASYYWDDDEDVDEDTNNLEGIYIGIGCTAAVILFLCVGIGYLCLKMFKLKTNAATERLQAQEQRQMDIELLDFVSVDLD